MNETVVSLALARYQPDCTLNSKGTMCKEYTLHLNISLGTIFETIDMLLQTHHDFHFCKLIDDCEKYGFTITQSRLELLTCELDKVWHLAQHPEIR